MDINVKLLDESTVTTNVEASSTIFELKTAIRKKIGIAESKQCLILDEKELKNDRKISSYEIQQGSTVIMEEVKFHVLLRVEDNIPRGHPLRLMMHETDSIQKMKDLIEQEEGIDTSDQILKFGGKELNDDTSTLEKENIRHGSTLILTICNFDKTKVPERDPIPPEAEKYIAELCEKHQVEFPLMIQDPADSKSIVVTGMGISKIESQLHGLQTSCPDLKVYVQERDSPLFIEPMFVQINKKSQAQRGWMGDGGATIEQFVFANETNKDNPERNGVVVYAVVSAHLVMSADQINDYASADTTKATAREEVEKTTTCTRYTATAPHIGPVDLRHPPLFGYRNWYNEPADMFMNDLALLQLDQEDAEQFHHLIEDSQVERVNKIFEISSASTLKKMWQREQPIVIGEAEGKLLQSFQSVRTDQTSCLHLAFVLTSEDQSGNLHQLVEGDSGRVLFYRNSYGKLRPMGLFAGPLKARFGSGAVEYAAIVLSEALKEIEDDYPHHVANIRPFFSDNRIRRRTC